MPDQIPGIHHVTAMAGDAQTNFEFYTDVLGLRLVKRSINQDDPTTYHLFYADGRGSPGTSMTFFPFDNATQGSVGAGQVGVTAFRVPEGSLDYWADRLDDHDVTREDPVERFGERVLPFEDPDGLPLELVEGDDAAEPWTEAVPEEYAVRGFHGVALLVRDVGPTAELLETMGYERVDGEADDDRTRYVSSGDLGAVVDLIPTQQAGRQGFGTVHHVAFRTPTDEDQQAWRETFADMGFDPTPVIDREWFHSVYFRGGPREANTGGVLFELATHEPGYTVDEPLEELGSSLVLPPKFEDMRDQIESTLPPLDTDD
ncbi:ring-cleaving dioxygenase [Halomarina oriensis]|uniref:Ring-cleaving dioxygenase n=1 Tax=Halomarina oriensis TaxID=671145 RepID=A0A6B0GN18_9EURY|nr:ring-cleaving dioxygenase [Halomarina oriensis]MWG35331.1 ring-cleaving dioxygenase [Halomarina oriensis]